MEKKAKRRQLPVNVEPKCDDCFYFRDGSGKSGRGSIGWCHRYPGKIEKPARSFCGEFRSKSIK